MPSSPTSPIFRPCPYSPHPLTPVKTARKWKQYAACCMNDGWHHMESWRLETRTWRRAKLGEVFLDLTDVSTAVALSAPTLRVQSCVYSVDASWHPHLGWDMRRRYQELPGKLVIIARNQNYCSLNTNMTVNTQTDVTLVWERTSYRSLSLPDVALESAGYKKMPPYRMVRCTSATMLPTYLRLFGGPSAGCLHSCTYLQALHLACQICRSKHKRDVGQAAACTLTQDQFNSNP